MSLLNSLSIKAKIFVLAGVAILGFIFNLMVSANITAPIQIACK